LLYLSQPQQINASTLSFIATRSTFFSVYGLKKQPC
jgi:hypothetical protein